MIIDSHAHIVADDRPRYPLRSVERLPEHSWFLDRGVTAEQFLDLMQDAGVDRAVVVQPGIAYGDDNQYLFDTVERHRERLVGVAGLPGSDLSVGDVDRALAVPGVAGVRLFGAGSEVVASPEALSIARNLASRGVPLVVYTDFEHVLNLEQLSTAVPDLDIVLDHGAVPHVPGAPGEVFEPASPLMRLAERDRIHIKVTPVMLAHVAEPQVPDVGRTLVDAFGPHRLLWGSDFPHSAGPYSAMVNQARRLMSDLPQSDQDDVLAGTAQRLWTLV